MATSVIRRYWVDLDDMRITSSLGDRSPITSIRLKARDSGRIGFQFHRGGTPELLASSTVLTFGIKARGAYSGSYLASVTSFTAATTVNTVTFADTDFYYGALDLNTAAITTAIGGTEASLSGMAELEIDISGSGLRFSTETVDVTILNDVNQGGEGTPTSADPPFPSASEVHRWKPGVTSLTGGTSADLDSIPTTSITSLPYAVSIKNLDVSATKWETWVLDAGTDAEDTGAGKVRPDDYNGATNAKVWTRQTYFPAADDDDISAAASATNYTPAASTVAGHLSGIDTKLGTIGTAISNVVEDTTPQSGGNFDFNGFNADFDDNTGIRDDSGNEQLIFQKTATAVNHLEATNAATGTAPSLKAAGGDSNVALVLGGKGTGAVELASDLDTAGNSIIIDNATGIVDENGNEVLTVTTAASAVNYIAIGNSATGSAVSLTAAGDDTNRSLNLVSAGTGTVQANGARIITTAGIAGGQTLTGGTASGNQLTLESTSHATKGGIALAASNFLDLPEIATPGTPASGFGRLYPTTAGKLAFKDDAGTVTLLGSSGGWRQIWIPAHEFRPATTAGCAALATYESTTNDVNFPILGFDDTTAESAWSSFVIPDDWDNTTNIKAKIHWITTATSGGVAWGVAGRSYGDNDTADQAPGTEVIIIDSSPATGRYLITAASDAITLTNAAVGEAATFRVRRNPSNGSDNFVGDAWLVGIEFQIYTTGGAAAW